MKDKSLKKCTECSKKKNISCFHERYRKCIECIDKDSFTGKKICKGCKFEKEISNFAFLNSQLKIYKNKCKLCTGQEFDGKKKCKTCGDVKLLCEFGSGNKSRLLPHCKICFQKSKRDNRKKDPERFKAYDKKRYEGNKEEILARNKKYRSKPENLEKQRVRLKNKRENDPIFKLRHDVGVLIRHEIKKGGKSFTKYVDYSIEELKEHLESQFELWMTWKNWGRYSKSHHAEKPTWQIDHIIPVSHFNITSMECDDFKKCWALSNLRPLDAKQNVIEGNRRPKKENG